MMCLFSITGFTCSYMGGGGDLGKSIHLVYKLFYGLDPCYTLIQLSFYEAPHRTATVTVFYQTWTCNICN